jgi:GH15 family glucan-1,4-alpha-glucosidase
MVDNLVGQGRLNEATELFESICARANMVGLLAEQVNPSDGAFMGNFPQAFSHVGLITSSVSIARAMGGGDRW